VLRPANGEPVRNLAAYAARLSISHAILCAISAGDSAPEIGLNDDARSIGETD